MIAFRKKENPQLIGFFNGSKIPNNSIDCLKLEVYRNGVFEKNELVPRSQIYRIYSPCGVLSVKEAYKFLAENFILERNGNIFAIVNNALSIFNSTKGVWYKVEFPFNYSLMTFSKLGLLDEQL